jgi:hypothetical protein
MAVETGPKIKKIVETESKLIHLTHIYMPVYFLGPGMILPCQSHDRVPRSEENIK